MTSLIEFAGVIGALMVSVLTAFLIARLWFETFFRTLAPCWHVAASQERPAETDTNHLPRGAHTPANEPANSDDPPETASRSASRSH